MRKKEVDLELVALLALLLLVVAAVLFMPHFNGITKPEDTLANQGYADIQIVRRSLGGCYDDETVGYKWQATNPSGEPREGTICGRADSGNMYWRIVQ